MPFSRKELFAAHEMSRERYREVTTALLEKLGANEKLTLAESKFICLKLRSIYKADDDTVAFKATDYEQCFDFLFWDKYLLYWNDHEGWGRIKNGPDSYVTDEQKKADVKFLDEHYNQWKVLVESNKFPNGIMQTVASETLRLVREILTYSKNAGDGSIRQHYKEKALFLHSKYLFYQVSEYYEENPAEETISFCGHL